MASSSATASASPETTSEVGPLTAAMLTRLSYEARASATSDSSPSTASMAPPDGSACISRPRAATSAHASPSDSTPATWAAASSPMECPRRKSGRMPHDSSSRKRETSSAKSAGCAWTVWSIASPSPKRTSRIGRSSRASSRSAMASSASAKAGKVSYSSRPIPARCAPCPVNRNAVRPCSAMPRTVCGPGRP